jgi:8-oxo-dGTP pyrophosphatase MutT (NUDIX family)
MITLGVKFLVAYTSNQPCTKKKSGYYHNCKEMLPRPAATIVVLCDDTASSFKVLMIRRHSKARHMPHAYVFPGGVAEEKDRSAADAAALPVDLPLRSLRVTALRELAEETGIILDGELHACAGKQANLAAAAKILPFAHWITPKQEKYRYDTLFFCRCRSAGHPRHPVFSGSRGGDRCQVGGPAGGNRPAPRPWP